MYYFRQPWFLRRRRSRPVVLLHRQFTLGDKLANARAAFGAAHLADLLIELLAVRFGSGGSAHMADPHVKLATALGGLPAASAAGFAHGNFFCHGLFPFSEKRWYKRFITIRLALYIPHKRINIKPYLLFSIVFINRLLKMISNKGFMIKKHFSRLKEAKSGKLFISAAGIIIGLAAVWATVNQSYSISADPVIAPPPRSNEAVLSSLTLSPSEAVIGSTITATILLSKPVTNSGVGTSIATSRNDYVNISSGKVSIPDGAADVNVPISTGGTVQKNTDVWITASYSGQYKTAKLVLKPK